MRTLKSFCVVLALALVTFAQAAQTAQTDAGRGAQTTAGQQTRAVGEVTAVDAAARQLKLKTDDGRTLTLQLDEATDLRRVPAGAARSDQAERITPAQVAVGDRVFARGTQTDALVFAARQVIVSS